MRLITGRDLVRIVRGVYAMVFMIEVMFGARDNVEPSRQADDAPVAAGEIPLSFSPPIYRPIAIEGNKLIEVLLDGDWRCNKNAHEDVASDPQTGDEWFNFRVPGQWAHQQGPLPENASAALGTDFEIPVGWQEKRIFLRFDAIHGNTRYWLNGKELGMTENYWTPVEYEITSTVRHGKKNNLRLIQSRNLVNEKIQFSGYKEQRHPPETGIPRSVHIFALPKVNISLLNIRTDFDKEYKDGELLLDVKLDGVTARGEMFVLDAILTDPSGQRVGLKNSSFHLSPAEEAPVRIRIPVSHPLQWSAEKPNLYVLTLKLGSGGQIAEQIMRNIGFRKIEIRGRQVFLNGRLLKLAGACHHEFDPITQRSGTAQYAEIDVLLMKACNMNFARTTHYPPTSEFLEACDRLGLYAEVEAPFMWTRDKESGQEDASIVHKYLQPTASMIAYHRNHPSVIMWSLANESGWIEQDPGNLPVNYQATHKLVKRMDSTRLTIFHSETDSDGRVCDIGNLHYPTYPFDGSKWIQNDSRPVMLGEAVITIGDSWFNKFVHYDPGLHEEWMMYDNLYWFAWGRRAGTPQQEEWRALHHPVGQNNPYSAWSQIYNSTHLLGMSIWEFGAHEFGIVDDWRRPKPIFWGMKRMLTPVYIPIRQIDFKPGTKSVRIPIENRYAFTDLSECVVTFEISDTGVISGKSVSENLVARKISLSLAPGSKGEVEIPLPSDAKEGKLLIIRSIDSKGYLIDAHGILLGDHKEYIAKADSGRPEFEDDGVSIKIRCENLSFDINRSSGTITSHEGLPSPVLMVLPTPYLSNTWPGQAQPIILPQADTRKISSITIKKIEGGLVLLVDEAYDVFRGTLNINIDKLGTAVIAYEYTFLGQDAAVRELGLRFQISSACRNVSWRRKSEWDVYPEDQIGRPVGSATAQRDGRANVTDASCGGIFPVLPQSGSHLLQSKSPWWWIAEPKTNESKTWPWSMDDDGYGTRDFVSTKFNFYRVTLSAPDGSGIEAFSNGTAHARAFLEGPSTMFHVWNRGDKILKTGERVEGRCIVQLHGAARK